MITFTEEVAKLLKNPQISLHTQKIAEHALELSCVGNALTLKYPYPVDYDRIKIQLSRTQGTMSIQSPRVVHSFWNRPAVFTASPDNELCFPPITADKEFYAAIGDMQYSIDDHTIHVSKDLEPSLLPVDANVKKTFTSLLKTKNDERFVKFVNLETREVLALILFKSKLYDLENKSPAFDLYYHFIGEKSQELVNEPWLCMVKEDSVRTISMTKEEFLRLQLIFRHFSAQTRAKLSTSSSLLSSYGISQYFSRAVVYPLDADQDRFVLEMDTGKEFSAYISQGRQHLPAEEASDSSEHKTTSSRACHSTTIHSSFKVQYCDHCHSQSSYLKKCTRCDKAAYCNQDCQRSHWKEHRLICQPASRMAPKPAFDKCSACEKANKRLKKCLCHLAAYCSIECQRNDWPHHSATCKSAKGKK